MKKSFIVLAITLLFVMPDTKLVTLRAKQVDFRAVLFDLFSQVQKSFIVEMGIEGWIYLILEDITFEEALNLICRYTGTTFEIENDIYIFTKKKPVTQPVIPPKTADTGTSTNAATNPHSKPPTTPKVLDQNVLDKRLTTRIEMADIRAVFAEFSKQTGVPIEVAENVRNLKISAYYLDTSLRYALNSITTTAKLMYTFTDRGTILISDPEGRK
jgi:hypothetical protein